MVHLMSSSENPPSCYPLTTSMSSKKGYSYAVEPAVFIGGDNLTAMLSWFDVDSPTDTVELLAGFGLSCHFVDAGLAITDLGDAPWDGIAGAVQRFDDVVGFVGNCLPYQQYIITDEFVSRVVVGVDDDGATIIEAKW